MNVKTITAKVVIEEIKWARSKNSGILVIDDETMLNGIELALEKQVPRKALMLERNHSYFRCGECGSLISFTNEETEHNYCLHCGQKLDWS